ncbi:MAG: 50S ribosomal protein L10 [Parcubacteria group bacterium]|nr:50S ribosomal protein L10 [Parcubacteria group bacterium]
MALTRQKKEDIIKSVTESIKNAASVAFVKFHGLSVFDESALRRGLRERGVEYTVVKKTLLRRVLKSIGISGNEPELDGKVAIAHGADMVEPAKGIAFYERKLNGMVSLLGGILESRYLNKAEVTTLSAVPSRQTLLAQLVMVIYAPVTETVRTLHEVNRSFVSVLNQIAKSKN